MNGELNDGNAWCALANRQKSRAWWRTKDSARRRVRRQHARQSTVARNRNEVPVMKSVKPFTCRGVRSRKPWSIALVCAMMLSTINTVFVPTVQAQTAPVGAGFAIDAEDLRFIFHGIEIAQEHSVTRTAANPAAAAAAVNVCGSGGFVCSGAGTPDPGPGPAVFPETFDTSSIFIPNTTPDFGLSAPFNLMFTFFGQFFDHGLDLVTKGGGTVVMPLQPDDPLFRAGGPNIMVMT